MFIDKCGYWNVRYRNAKKVAVSGATDPRLVYVTPCPFFVET